MIELPAPFCQQIRSLLGPTEAETMLRAISETAPTVSVRLNTAKLRGKDVFGNGTPVPWCATGRYLPERPLFTADPLLHAGAYYVQEAASMFVEQAYKKICADFVPRRVLDLCAAPGGKSTLWRSLMDDGALLVANEPIRQRAQILAENLTKWGHPDTICTSAYPEEFAPLSSFFDIVAADVPCSGEGMFRKDAGAVNEWSTEAVLHCAERQRQIITDVWDALRTGGYLVYSTCTYNAEENERNVRYICDELGAEPVALDVPQEWNISGDATGNDLPVYHFYPHRTQGEGLFLALLRKTASASLPKEKKKKKQGKDNRQATTKGAEQVAAWLQDNTAYKIFRPDDTHLAAVKQSLYDDAAKVCGTVRALTAGILLAEERGHKRIPQHALALSTALAPDAFAQVPLKREEALSYLRREALTLAPDVPRGYVLATYEGHPLGFLNNLGTRANNLYPQEWRIRHLAE